MIPPAGEKMSCIYAIYLFSLTTMAGVDKPIDFNRDIRPILSENCFYCHGQDANKKEKNVFQFSNFLITSN